MTRQARRALARELGIEPARAPELITLRPLQERAVEAVRAEIRRGRKSILLVAPTGFGKTAVSSVLIARSVTNGKRVLFLVHRREIVRATAKRLARAGVACGIVMADEPAPEGVSVLVCSVQTLAIRGLRPPADVIFWDEAHHNVASSYRAIKAAYPDALHIGLTATPERSDGVGLGDAFESLVVAASMRELVDAGLLVPCDVVAPAERVDGLAWPVLEAWRKHADGRRTVIFAANVAHARALVGEFVDAGVPAACIYGGLAKTVRDEVLSDFDDGNVTVLVNVFCLTEGWDSPSTEVCMLARGVGSAAMFLQTVGRVLRTAPGKKRALLLDLFGAVHEHGLPDEPREFSLEGAAIRQVDALPPLRTCPECGATFRTKPVCPRCSFVFPPPPAPRVLATGIAHIAGVTATREEKRAVWDRLCRDCRARGYQPGWAAHKFRDRFGHWPARNFPKVHEVAS